MSDKNRSADKKPPSLLQLVQRIYRRIIANDKNVEANYCDLRSTVSDNYGVHQIGIKFCREAIAKLDERFIGQYDTNAILSDMSARCMVKLDSLSGIVAHTERLLKEKETLQRRLDAYERDPLTAALKIGVTPIQYAAPAPPTFAAKEPPTLYVEDGVEISYERAMELANAVAKANTYMGMLPHSHGMRGFPPAACVKCGKDHFPVCGV